ncbi:MAG: streptomycin biosynthesis regulator, partial [Blastocatellia bacterium]
MKRGMKTDGPTLDSLLVTDVELKLLRTDGGTQVRARLNPEKVDEYGGLMSADAAFPPIDAFYDGQHDWVADGFKRWAAAGKAGKTTFPTRVHQGTVRDALKFALSANARHGLPRSPGDKRGAVEIALRDVEWGKLNNHQIGRLCAVTDEYVRQVRRLIFPNHSCSTVTVSRG